MTRVAPAFPRQRPTRAVAALFKAGARFYRGPVARILGEHAMLLLTTTGRKSGVPRTTALTFMPLGGRYVVGSGMGTRSDWYQNLLAEPRIGVQIGKRRFAASARPILDPALRRVLVPEMAAYWDRYGPPRPLRWLLRSFCQFDYDAELQHARAHAEDVPLVEIVPSDPPGVNSSR